MVLLNVGPLNSAPSVRARTLFRLMNGASPPNDPRLSPNTTSFGRCASGICRISLSTASNSAWPACRAFSLSTRNDSQLGRNEYCMLTIAVLPLYMYSSAEASASLIQPVPVVVATAMTARCSPPVRCSSRAANSAVACDAVRGVQSGVGPDRFGGRGAVERREFVDARAALDEDAPLMAQRLPGHQRLRAPDRSGVFGAAVSGFISLLTALKVLFMCASRT